MLSPEAQNYITQSRASGVADQQIRQSLLSQGWPGADVDQALGMSSAVKKTFPAWAKILIALVILGFVISALSTAAGIFSFFALKNQPGSPVSSVTKTNSGVDACGGWPGSNPDEVQLFHSDTTLPSEFPSDYPPYPGSAYVGYFTHTSDISPVKDQSKTIGIYYFCTGDSVKQVLDYFNNLKSTRWNVATSANIVDADNTSAQGGQLIRADTHNPKSPSSYFYSMTTLAAPAGNKTLIRMYYSVLDMGN